MEQSSTLAQLARTHEQPAMVARADAVALPLRDASADLVVASMSLQDVDDLDGAVAEAARVLVPGGRICASVVHPINSSGRHRDEAPDAPFVLAQPFLATRRYRDDLVRDGLTMTFHSMHHSFEGYTRAFERAGLLIDAVREPPTPDELVAVQPHAAQWQRVPIFLFVRAVKP